MADKTIKERLAILETQICIVIKHLENHLSSHNRLYYIWVGAIVAIVVNIVIQLIRV